MGMWGRGVRVRGGLLSVRVCVSVRACERAVGDVQECGVRAPRVRSEIGCTMCCCRGRGVVRAGITGVRVGGVRGGVWGHVDVHVLVHVLRASPRVSRVRSWVRV